LPATLHAEHDRLIHPSDNPAAKVTKPRRLPSARHALSLEQVHDLGRIASTTGDDGALAGSKLEHTVEPLRLGRAIAAELVPPGPPERLR
jgi:hypothetical protein